MTEQSIEFSFRARYFKSGDVARAKKIWFVLHGYGQLAPFFVKKFNFLVDQGVAIIAPEGLSRFYLEDATSRIRSGNNRVGATWMTRESRETDITNYLEYLESICRAELAVANDPNITVLGFSQGAATASRWVAHTETRVNRLILWAGIFPPDMNPGTATEKFKNMEILSVCGRNDPFFSNEKYQEMSSISSQLGVAPRQIYFEGAHELDSATLSSLA